MFITALGRYETEARTLLVTRGSFHAQLLGGLASSIRSALKVYDPVGTTHLSISMLPHSAPGGEARKDHGAGSETATSSSSSSSSPPVSASYRLPPPANTRKRKPTASAPVPLPLPSVSSKKPRRTRHDTQASPSNTHSSEFAPYPVFRSKSFTSRFENPNLTPLFIPPPSVKLGALEVDPRRQKMCVADVATPRTADLKLPSLGRTCQDGVLPGFHEVLNSAIEWRLIRWDVAASGRKSVALSPRSVG
ncbi:hypothetical protein FN846DRAFT_974052 [Sphaerosporella brunnea]|uniref:Uncharacterized protein n=1 Tax=Sphaerosporella brunnea TaxID=1250544 RepID=A0A5J5EHG6_9PEZI|nr:hypothetical protein FN846DRAFT_974052 [Sphaerosporella brunnea]